MTHIDYGGAFPDEELPDGTRIRFHLNDDPRQAITVCIEDGRLVLTGQYRALLTDREAPNKISVWTVSPPNCRTYLRE